MYGKYAYSVSMRKLFLIVLVIISAAILNASEAGDSFMESLAIAGYTSEKVHEEERGITTSIGASIGYYGGYRMPGYMRLGVTFIQGFAERGETMLGFRLDGSAYTYGSGKDYPGYDIAALFYHNQPSFKSEIKVEMNRQPCYNKPCSQDTLSGYTRQRNRRAGSGAPAAHAASCTMLS